MEKANKKVKILFSILAVATAMSLITYSLAENYLFLPQANENKTNQEEAIAPTTAPAALDQTLVSARLANDGGYSARLEVPTTDGTITPQTPVNWISYDTIDFINVASPDIYYSQYTSSTGNTPIGGITMLDFNNDSITPTNLITPGYYTDAITNSLSKITTINVNDKRSGTPSPLNEIGYYSFSGDARIFTNNVPGASNFHDYYLLPNGTPAPAFSSLRDVKFNTDGSVMNYAKIKVIHAGAFSRATNLNEVDFSSHNEITYIDEPYGPSPIQVVDFAIDPTNVPTPIYSSTGGDYATNIGVFEGDTKLTGINLFQRHWGEYGAPTGNYNEATLKNIPARFFTNDVALNSFNVHNNDPSYSLFLPNSVQSVGSYAFYRVGYTNGSKLSLYFPEPNKQIGQLGIEECANDIFGTYDGANTFKISDIYLPDPNPSQNFLIGLKNSLSKFSVGKDLTLHVPFDFNSSPSGSYDINNAMYSTYCKAIDPTISTAPSSQTSYFSWKYIAPTSYEFEIPSSIPSTYAGATTDIPTYLFGDPGSFDGANIIKITPLPHNAYMPASDLTILFNQSSNDGVIAIQQIALSDQGVNSDKTAKPDGWGNSDEDGKWLIAPKYTISTPFSAGSNDSVITLTPGVNSIYLNKKIYASDSINLDFWSVKFGNITYTSSVFQVAQQMKAGSTASDTLATATFSPSVQPTIHALDLSQFETKIINATYYPDGKTSAPVPVGWNSIIGVSSSISGDLINATPVITIPAIPDISLCGLYTFAIACSPIDDSNKTSITNKTYSINLWQISDMNVNATSTDFQQGFSDSVWSLTYSYPVPIVSFIYQNGFKPVGSGTGYPTDNFALSYTGSTPTLPASATATIAANALTLGGTWYSDGTSKQYTFTTSVSASDDASIYKSQLYTLEVGPLSDPTISFSSNTGITDNILCSNQTGGELGTKIYSFNSGGHPSLDPTFEIKNSRGSVVNIPTTLLELDYTTDSSAPTFKFHKNDWSSVSADVYTITLTYTFSDATAPKSTSFIFTAWKLSGIDVTSGDSFDPMQAGSSDTGTTTCNATLKFEPSSFDPSKLSDFTLTFNWTIVAKDTSKQTSLEDLVEITGTTSVATLSVKNLSTTGETEAGWTPIEFDTSCRVIINDSLGGSTQTLTSNPFKSSTSNVITLWWYDATNIMITNDNIDKFTIGNNLTGGKVNGVYSLPDPASFSVNLGKYGTDYSVQWDIDVVNSSGSTITGFKITTDTKGDGTVSWPAEVAVDIETYTITPKITYTIIESGATFSKTNDGSASIKIQIFNNDNYPVSGPTVDLLGFTAGGVIMNTDGSYTTGCLWGEKQTISANFEINDTNAEFKNAHYYGQLLKNGQAFTNDYLTVNVLQVGDIIHFSIYYAKDKAQGFTPDDPNFAKNFDYQIQLLANVEGQTGLAVYTTDIKKPIHSYTISPQTLTATYIDENGTNVNNGDNVKWHAGENDFVKPSFTLKVDPNHFDPNTAKNTTAINWIYQKIAKNINTKLTVMQNGKSVALPEGIEFGLNKDYTTDNFGSIGLKIDISKFSKDELKKYYGLYTINATYEISFYGSSITPIAFTFGFNVEISGPTNHGSVGALIGEIIGGIAGAIGIGFVAKIFVNKARAKKLLKEDEEDGTVSSKSKKGDSGTGF